MEIGNNTIKFLPVDLYLFFLSQTFFFLDLYIMQPMKAVIYLLYEALTDSIWWEPFLIWVW